MTGHFGSPRLPESGAADTTAQTHFDRMFQMIMAAWGSQVVRTLAILSVAEHLGVAPSTAEEIARRESSDPSMTYRVLRAAAAMGIVEYDAATRCFSSTPLLSILHKDSASSLKHYAQTSAGPVFWGPALFLPETVVRGRHHVTETLGCDVFEYFGGHPDEAAMFAAGMTDLSGPVTAGAVAAMDLAGARSVVDVGGANGAFLCEVLRRHPGLTGEVLDLPHVMPGVAEEARRHKLTDRIAATPGDFFVSVPTADVYLLKHILHDWDDESCAKILTNIRSAMHQDARIFIVEMVIDPAEASASAALTDMAMLFATTGRERELGEYEALLELAGLRANRVMAIHPPYSMIEVRAA